MCLLYATQHNQNIPGTFQDIFYLLLKINNLTDFRLGDSRALALINPCADSMHGSSNDPPALHQRTSAANSSSQNDERRLPPPPTIPNASEQYLSELHHSEPTVENFTSPQTNNRQPNTPIIVPAILNDPDQQLPEIHPSEATTENSTSPQTNNQQPGASDNNDDANDTFHSCGGETTPTHLHSSLIETVSTEDQELNSSEGLSQSTPFHVKERQRTSPIKCKVLVDRSNEENVLFTKTFYQIN